MTDRNADAPNRRTDARTAEGRQERAATTARNERNADMGETVNADSIPDLPDSADLHTDGTEEMDSFQQEGQRKDVVSGNVRGTSDAPIAGEQYVGQAGELDGTNAVTNKTRAALVDNPSTFTVESGTPVRTMSDLKAVIYDLVGTQNIKPGKMYTAIKSTNFRFPGDRGNRAAIAHKDGSITYLSNGTTYDQWYAALQQHQNQHGGAIGLIFRFDQSLEAKNPFTQCDVYEFKNLPEVEVESELGW